MTLLLAPHPFLVHPFLAAPFLALAGAAAGAGARLLLARLRRGARVRAPVCECAVAALWGVVGAAWAGGVLATVWLPALLGLGWLAVAAGAVDVRHHRLPDTLTVPALPVALLLVLPVGGVAVARGALAAAVAVALHAAVHLAAPLELGAGDVKLSGSLGAVLGAASWHALAAAAVLASAGTAVTAVALAVAARARGRPVAAGVAHGPSMLAAAWLVTFAAGGG